MANTLLTPDIIAGTAVELLTRQIVLPQLMWRDFERDFSGKIGDSVTVRVPAVLTAREYDWRNDRTSAIVADNVEEDSITVAIDKHPYSAVNVTDEDFDRDVMDFAAQILLPQARAVGEKLEAYCAAEMAGATYATSLELDTTDPWATLIDASAALNASNVSRSDRVLVVGSSVEAELLKSEKVSRADQSGQTGVLRDAFINRLAGFTIVGSNAIAADKAYAFHRSAFILVTRAPAVSSGVTAGSSTTYGPSTAGLAMRWIRDYDATRLQDRSVVSAFAGTQVVTDSDDLVRAVEITYSES